MHQLLLHTNEYSRLYAGLQKPGITALFGLPPVGRMAIAAALALQSGRPLLVVTSGEAEATRASLDLEAFGMKAEVFPSRDYMLRPFAGAGREYEYRRLSVLGCMVGGRVNAVCVPVEGLMQYTVPKADFCANTLTLQAGQSIPRQQLISALFNAGYIRRDRVDGPAQFSVRGEIVDVFTPDREYPSRIEFWGDEIDTIADFEILSQRRSGNIHKLHISPAREVLFGNCEQTADTLEQALQQAPARGKKAMQAAMQQDLDSLHAGVMPEDLDKYLRVRYPQPGLLWDYFDNPIVLYEEPAAIAEAQRAVDFRRGQELEGLLEEGVLCSALSGLYPDAGQLYAPASVTGCIAAENFARSLTGIKLAQVVDIPSHALPVWGGSATALQEDLQPLLAQGYAAVVYAGTSRGAAALSRDLFAAGVRASADQNAPLVPGSVVVRHGSLTGGVQLPFAKLALFSGRRHGTSEKPNRRKTKAKQNALSSLAEINPGDYVVHQNHGVGVYAGIRQLSVQGVTKDYLQITYAKGDTLYVPVTQLDLLSRYAGPAEGEQTVKITRLGGNEWAKTKSKAKAAAELIAKDLVQLYARRSKAPGFAFEPDGDWQRDFETRFEYDETDDQLSATAEIKRDMERPHPMDRLLCGDVGVGKTEVALRAAFKCVMSGKQCAILAPTTLLAWQHYNTVIARMEPFGFGIGLLSRMRTATQQKKTLTQLAAGSCDIVVGTHRLLSKDVKFKDLGLVIIDEEQRFGVKHKERLKESFIGVDMLTLSATPIPRTLNMALNGIRDMSTIEEPPVERRPVETYVTEYDDGIVAEAIRKELARGGQVYYLHNRVDNMERTAAKVKAMVPDARIGVAHGRMSEEELSDVWQALVNNDIDVLVCTTLIETGVDVRNCNTLIVEDADRMGLSQLYQIRGRVGRSGRKAYAYFTFRRDKVLTDIAGKRLSAVREFTSFGSGFRIAMRDLQIRGAGSMLGSTQHGHMQNVGYDLYMKILGRELALAKGEELPPDKSDCLVDIAVDAFIPNAFIPDSAGRIEAYKRIANIQNAEDAADVLDELIDRYGDVPSSVSSLVDVSLVRVQAAEQKFYEISQKEDCLLLYGESITARGLLPLITAMPGKVMLNASAKPYISVKVSKGENPLAVLRQVLQRLAETEAVS